MPSKIPQVRRLNYNGEDIGMGFNSDTGLGVGTALDFAVPTSEIAQVATSDFTIVTSHEELVSKLHMSAEFEGRYGFVSGGAKVDFAKDTSFNSSSTFVVARMVVTNTVSRGTGFTLKPNLQHLLDTDPEGFQRAFGDSFVRAHYKGGEFYAVMRVTSVDSKTQSNLSVKLHLEAQGLIASGSFKGEFSNANSQEKTRSEFQLHFYQTAGAGRAEIGTPLDLEEIKARLKDFPDAVQRHGFPFFVEVATYDTIPLPINKEQQEDFLMALSDAHQKKLRYFQRRNDCDFAAEHPEFFFQPPTRPELLAMSATYTQLANAAIAHAIAVSNGSTVQLFDPSKLSPPIAEPDLLLRKRDVGLESSFADWWVTKENPATRKNDRDLVEDIANVARFELNEIGEIADPSGDPEKTERLVGEALARIVSSFREYDWNHAGQHTAGRGPLTSLSALPTMLPLTITSLWFSGNDLGQDRLGEIRDTKGLEQFSALVRLDLSHNNINSIAELGGLKALRSLNLVNNAVSDLQPLRGCVSLEDLDISGNDITDLTPLGACKALKRLTFCGTVLIKNGVATRSGNPLTDIRALADVPCMRNPFTIGNVLSIRFGVLSDGPTAQFNGTANRIGNSHLFRVHLTRGNEVLDDTWTLQSILNITPLEVESLSIFFQNFVPVDVPLTGVLINLVRPNKLLDFNLTYVDLNNPQKSGFDLSAFPAFETKTKLRTIDAVVIS